MPDTFEGDHAISWQLAKKIDWYGLAIAAIFALIFAVLVDRAPEIFNMLFRVAVADIEYVNFGLALAALLFAVWARFSPKSVIRAQNIVAGRFELQDLACMIAKASRWSLPARARTPGDC
jgi:hypothetical protein